MDTKSENEETALARLIREQGRLKAFVARQLGCDYSRLAKLIAGRRSMTVVEAVRAADLFGVDVREFLPPQREEGRDGR